MVEFESFLLPLSAAAEKFVQDCKIIGKTLDGLVVWLEVAIVACEQDAALACFGVHERGEHVVDGSYGLATALGLSIGAEVLLPLEVRKSDKDDESQRGDAEHHRIEPRVARGECSAVQMEEILRRGAQVLAKVPNRKEELCPLAGYTAVLMVNGNRRGG